jgi:hypothetical protein
MPVTNGSQRENSTLSATRQGRDLSSGSQPGNRRAHAVRAGGGEEQTQARQLRPSAGEGLAAPHAALLDVLPPERHHDDDDRVWVSAWDAALGDQKTA